VVGRRRRRRGGGAVSHVLPTAMVVVVVVVVGADLYCISLPVLPVTYNCGYYCQLSECNEKMSQLVGSGARTSSNARLQVRRIAPIC